MFDTLGLIENDYNFLMSLTGLICGLLIASITLMILKAS